MNESSGSTLEDGSGKSNNGVIANSQWVGGVMQSEPNHTFSYGYFEARIQAPSANSTWPAFWMLAPCCNSLGTPNEIDVFEMNASFDGVNGVDQTVHSVGCPNNSSCYYQTRNLSPIPSQGFHRYGVLWNSTTVTFYIDGTQTASFSDSTLTTAMYLILSSGVVTPSQGSTYAPNPADYPQYLSASGIWAFTQGSSGCGSTTLPTGSAALSGSSYCINNVTYSEAAPPTDSFDTFNQYNSSTNPSGTWQTLFPGDRGGFLYTVDNTTAGFDIWPYTTGSSGLTIEMAQAPNAISGYRQSALANGTAASLGTLGSANNIANYQNWNYLRSGYTPVSGSFSQACYVSIPSVSETSLLIGTNDPDSVSPENKGWDVAANASGDMLLSIGDGRATETTSGVPYPANAPEVVVVTYNNATRVATLYVGNTSSPASTSVTLPSAYTASGNAVYFNAGAHNWGAHVAGGQYEYCSEWDGTVLTSVQVDALAADAL